MSNRVVTPTEFSPVLKHVLNECSEETKSRVDGVSNREANTVVREIKAASAAVYTKRSKKGSYKTGWAKRKKKIKSGYDQYTIYNKKKYMLTHLLENGHEIWVWIRAGSGPGNGHSKDTGRSTSPRPHIRPVAEKSAERYYKDIKEALRR